MEYYFIKNTNTGNYLTRKYKYLNFGVSACDGTLDSNALFERKDLKDLNFFTYKEEAKEIYLPSNSIDECLNRILEIQKPSMDIIKEAQRKETSVPVIQAKIYQIAA